MLDVMREVRECGVELCTACSAVLSEYPNMEDMDRLHLAIQMMKASRSAFSSCMLSFTLHTASHAQVSEMLRVDSAGRYRIHNALTQITVALFQPMASIGSNGFP